MSSSVRQFASSPICVISCVVFFISCQKNKVETAVQPAFYHWQTNLQLTDSERLLIDSLGVKKLYVKFFDVDWDAATQQPVPLAEVDIDTTNLAGLEIVPTVFITNRTFQHLENPKFLSERILEKIDEIGQSKNLSFREIQMDCDWTESTREPYFQFLTSLRPGPTDHESRVTSHELSATIRLHQFKYPDRTGVPPVDRGMLMVYNMGEVDEWETENSILHLGILDQYLPNHQSPITNYPLPLDLALPLFRWGVVFRDGELNYLVNDLGEEHLQDTLRFENLGPRRYEVRKSTYLQGYFLYQGDRIRLEGVSPELLEGAATAMRPDKFSKPVRSDGAFTVAFYHLDTSTLRVFHKKTLEKALEIIQR